MILLSALDSTEPNAIRDQYLTSLEKVLFVANPSRRTTESFKYSLISSCRLFVNSCKANRPFYIVKSF